MISIKKNIDFIIPLGILFVLIAVLGGIIIGEIGTGLYTSALGSLLGVGIFLGNKKLLKVAMSKKNSASANAFLLIYVLCLMLGCGITFFLVALHRFEALLCTGTALVLQLFALSVVEACRTIKKEKGKTD